MTSTRGGRGRWALAAVLIAVEPTACPSLTKGQYVYDFGDAVGMAPLVCKLYDEQCIEAVAVPQLATFEAAIRFARSEGIIPAAESAHAIRIAIDEALTCKKAGRGKAILFNLSGHGAFDIGAYEACLAGKLQDYDYPTAKVEEALKHLPNVKG